MQDGEPLEGFMTINSAFDMSRGYAEEIELGFSGLRD
jgi:hypothetical protein